MKVLVLAPQPFYQDRGTPIATLKLLHILSQQGHTIDLLTFHEGSAIDVPNCRHVRIAAPPWIRNVPPGFSLRKLICDLIMIGYVIRMCRGGSYDVVHAIEESVFMAMMVRVFWKIPYIYDMDSSLPRQLEDRFPPLKVVSPILRAIERRAIRQSHGVVAVCRSLEQLAAEHSPEARIVRVEDASLLTASRAFCPEASELRQLADSGPVLMYVGNLERYQGVNLLLDAFVHIFHHRPHVQLVIIGGSQEHVLQYRRRAERIGIGARTHFLGPQPLERLGNFLRLADVLVSPRVAGSNTPMKIFSYLESGKPVLATRLDTHTQVLDDDVSLLVEANPLEMARGMTALLDDEALRTRISRNARVRMRQRFSVQRLEAKLTKFYRELATTLSGQTC